MPATPGRFSDATSPTPRRRRDTHPESPRTDVAPRRPPGPTAPHRNASAGPCTPIAYHQIVPGQCGPHRHQSPREPNLAVGRDSRSHTCPSVATTPTKGDCQYVGNGAGRAVTRRTKHIGTSAATSASIRCVTRHVRRTTGIMPTNRAFSSSLWPSHGGSKGRRLRRHGLSAHPPFSRRKSFGLLVVRHDAGKEWQTTGWGPSSKCCTNHRKIAHTRTTRISLLHSPMPLAARENTAGRSREAGAATVGGLPPWPTVNGCPRSGADAETRRSRGRLTRCARCPAYVASTGAAACGDCSPCA